MIRQGSFVTDYVRITRIARVPGRRESLAVGHWLEGFLINPPRFSESVRVLRLVTNGRTALGWFATTGVVELRPGAFRTRNSVYELRVLPIPARLALTEEEYKVTLARAATLLDTAPGPYEEAELEAWTQLIEKHEEDEIKG